MRRSPAFGKQHGWVELGETNGWDEVQSSNQSRELLELGGGDGTLGDVLHHLAEV